MRRFAVDDLAHGEQFVEAVGNSGIGDWYDGGRANHRLSSVYQRYFNGSKGDKSMRLLGGIPDGASVNRDVRDSHLLYHVTDKRNVRIVDRVRVVVVLIACAEVWYMVDPLAGLFAMAVCFSL